MRALARFWDGDVAYSFRRSPVAVVSALVLATLLAGSMFAGWLAPYNPFDLASLNLMDSLKPPAFTAEGEWDHLLGTDGQGRDVLSGIMHGARISFTVGICAVAFAVVVGVTVGLVVGFLVSFVRRALRSAVLDTSISLITPFAAFLIGELLHGSGVLAVVVTGLYLGYRAPVVSSAEARVAERLNWRTFAFLLENAVFLLIGLQTSWIVGEVSESPLSTATIVAACVATLAAVIVLRYFEDLTEVRTAAELGISRGAVKSMSRQALQRLRVLAPELADLVGADT